MTQSLLDNIDSPADLKKVPQEKLPQLALELREFLINAVSKTGGHLASSLGAVELAIALHYVFKGPEDDIIWDVGHQAYAHKILTGRKNAFGSLRSLGGISGFPNPKESPYDAFGVGHASTSVAAGLGMCVAKELNGSDDRVVAVIGDGSMTAGLAFEGLNQAGHFKSNIIVILNDNEMSISSNVGALSSFLSRKITGRFANKIKREVESFFNSIPLLGGRLLNLAKRAEDSIISLITPGMLFEGLGFHYLGPIDGHNIHELISALSNAKEIKSPVLVHCLTKKGKGYSYAEKEPSRFHGVGAFDVKTGKTKKSVGKTYTGIFSETLLKIAAENEKVIAITAAMTEGTGMGDFAKRFPERFFDVGIAEQLSVTFAAGLATKGFIPVIAVYSTFLQRAYDEVLHDVCLQDLHVVMALDRAGLVGQDGATHHGLFDISYLRHIPNIVLMAPKDEDELRHLLYTAINMAGPVAIRYPRGVGYGVDTSRSLTKLSLGSAELIHEGRDLNILATGSMVYPAIEASDRLKNEGFDVGVVNCRFIKPLDEELITRLASDHGILLAVEENALSGGFGSAVMELLEEKDVVCEVKRIGVPDKFIEHGSQQELRSMLGLDVDGIEKKAREILDGCRKRRKDV